MYFFFFFYLNRNIWKFLKSYLKPQQNAVISDLYAEEHSCFTK